MPKKKYVGWKLQPAVANLFILWPKVELGIPNGESFISAYQTKHNSQHTTTATLHTNCVVAFGQNQPRHNRVTKQQQQSSHRNSFSISTQRDSFAAIIILPNPCWFTWPVHVESTDKVINHWMGFNGALLINLQMHHHRPPSQLNRGIDLSTLNNHHTALLSYLLSFLFGLLANTPPKTV